ncbi:hypothetical protein REPUB_Repub08aG0022300 [Reevesia pubescens]
MPFLTETSASASASSSSSSTIAEHLKLRRPTRNQINITEIDPHPVPEIPSLIQSTRSKSSISSLFLFTFTSTNNETTTFQPSTNTKKKGNPFSQSTLRGLGCTASASQQVSVPAMIRTSADWEGKKVKKKKKTQQQEQKKKKKKKKNSKLVGNEDNNSNRVHHQQGLVLNEGSGNNISCGVIQDVWCGPGIGFSADAVGSVDCVVARRNVPARGKIDVERSTIGSSALVLSCGGTVRFLFVSYAAGLFNGGVIASSAECADGELDRGTAEMPQSLAPSLVVVGALLGYFKSGPLLFVVARRWTAPTFLVLFSLAVSAMRSCTARRTENPETLSFLDSDSAFISTRPEPDFLGSRYYRHVRHPSPEGLAEIMMLQNNLLMGGRLDSRDRFSDWRLDIDNMSYEQLLELGDKIGYVNTGLKEDEISRCLRKMKGSVMNDLPPNFPMHVDKKCSICQEEYEGDEEMGKLYCGHSFHIQCIKQWLVHKNTCPVCKTEATAGC